jgi:inhibitor of KinA
MNTRVLAAGDSAWLVELPERIDPDVNAHAIAIARAVEQAPLPIVDVVVGYRSVMVYIDPLAEGADAVPAAIEAIAAAPPLLTSPAGAIVDVPVCYDEPYGPDLGDVAAFAEASPDDVIAWHLACEYRVFVVGFVPGFAYMASVDARIAAPRRSSPRLKVPPGSVAIAAGQTGIYPAATPGGWNVIGRCPIKPYDPDRAAPFLFHAGDRVRFRRIDGAEYRGASQWGDA